ncbi:DUF349 domain-containing protein [Arthrobacter mobilis]|uniref:DUF349 domain-containing protein n=1 Tax=Arthrobacter mobilis TaxID=2724944 RepID=A0A7X6HBK2_9MICC|nr:DUF349 domain-containing protein [Arthrobacter mobilis]NKX54079.1 DUF349 domain-containing protein [Arthrobacter mobilis]
MTNSQKSDEATDYTTDAAAQPAGDSGAAAKPAPRPTPAAIAPKPAAAQPVVAAPAVQSTPLSEAAKWGRVSEDGHVFLLLDGEEHPVGHYPDASPEEALSYFVRKYDDVAAQIALLEQRVEAKAPAADMQKTLSHLQEQLTERHMVGDVPALQARLDALGAAIAQLQRNEKAEQEAVRAAELAAREAIVAEAEELAAKDPATVQWKSSSARMNELFEAWKAAQKNGVRLGRATEDSLWKRFRSARTVFDRHRRAYFSQLDSDNAAAKAAKEALIARAEELSTSTDWGATAGEYRRLMDQWKASKRASRKDDDALWARFRAAQDRFFSARQAANQAVDREYAANLVVKEGLLAEAQTLLPVTDLAAAKKALQSIRERWEEAGKVPRADMQRVEAGLRKVEDAVKAAEDEHWRRTNPETQARTSSALSQLEAAIESLEADLAQAEQKGDERAIAEAREALAARRQWLETLQKAAQDFA